jgi:hypothetical protein
MNASFRIAVCVTSCLALLGARVERAVAMAFEEFGPPGEHIGRSAEWTKDVEDVLRHQSRVYWYDVNGSEAAYYDGDLATVNELLALYSQIDQPEHPIVIRPGRSSAKSLHGKMTPYVAEFTVPGGLAISFLGSPANSAGLYSTKPA